MHHIPPPSPSPHHAPSPQFFFFSFLLFISLNPATLLIPSIAKPLSKLHFFLLGLFIFVGIVD